MANELPWKFIQNIRDHATRQGEEIALAYALREPPIDPFFIVREEGCIHAEGGDLADAFDGCLEYVGSGRFLLAFNTKYNQWTHSGDHHPKVRFTVAHELGHYFRDEHRKILKNGGSPLTCTTEFTADFQMEQEADCFAAGLLMPSQLLAPIVNDEPEPTLATVRQVASDFDVSLTSMLVRWVRLSDFPCAIFAIKDGKINWGCVSEALAKRGAFRKIRGPVSSREAQTFSRSGTGHYREGKGLGLLGQWVETDANVSVSEHYAAIPYANHILCFLTAPEDEFASRDWDDDD